MTIMSMESLTVDDEPDTTDVEAVKSVEDKYQSRIDKFVNYYEKSELRIEETMKLSKDLMEISEGNTN